MTRLTILRADDGQQLPLDPIRWHQEPTGLEQRLLATMEGPVLDVGCGPGRLVVGLARLGRPALGVDPAPGAVALARVRGAPVLQRSVFDPLPGSGRWQSVLLVDGNIGIGGDPVCLLRRCRQLAAPSGTIVVEVDPPGSGCRRCRARLESGSHHSPWFPWAVVSADSIAAVAAKAGLGVLGWQEGEGRWLALLGRSESAEASRAVA
jgi:SAM-dependent methyltransferase